jgi:hypothetical protein
LKRFGPLIFRFNISTLQRFRLICLRASAPGDCGNNRMMGRRYAMAHCFRIAGTCSAAKRASGLLLFACAIASLMFCVLGLPWAATTKAHQPGKNKWPPAIRYKRFLVKTAKPFVTL